MADRSYYLASLLISVVAWTGENDTKTISVDANRFENGAQFSFENGLVRTGSDMLSYIKKLELITAALLICKSKLFCYILFYYS